jgi:hypothetical protein
MRTAPVLLLLAALSGCASVHHVMLSAPRPAIDPAQVKVYQVPPKQYVEIARLDAKSGAGFGTQGQIDATINRLANEAAKLGANGVILLGVDSSRSPVSMGVGAGSYGRHSGASIGFGIPTTQQRAEGIAIYVTEE